MHLNAKGKESVISKLIEVMSVSLHKQYEKEVIPMSWRNDSLEITDVLKVTNASQSENVKQIVSSASTSDKLIRKPSQESIVCHNETNHRSSKDKKLC
jgi:hypothetical protein